MLDQKRHLFKGLEKNIGQLFSYLPITPNQWTLISVITGLLCIYFLIKQNLILTLITFAISGFSDFINGVIARHRNIYTRLFTYLDTVADRYVDGFILLGMLFLPLPRILLPGYVWIFIILFGSLLTAFVKAAAKEKELVSQELKGGFITRSERIILLLIALFLGIIDKSYFWMIYLLIIIAIITNITALQRVYSAIKLNINRT